MNLKTFSFLLIFSFFTISIYAQKSNNNRVTVEDQGASEKWKENDDKYRALDKDLSDLMKHWNNIYSNLYKTGFSRVNGDMSKNNLTNFVNQAEKFKSDLRNNTQMRRLRNELNNLATKTSRSIGNPIEQTYINPKINSVDGDISSAKGIINEIETNESKKEMSVGFGSSTGSSSNTNSTTTSSSGSRASSSAADNSYQESLARQKEYTQALQASATQLVSVGVDIVNQIKQDRINNINYKNKKISEYLNKIMPLDKECADLYDNNNYEGFLLKDKELKKYESWTIDNLNWLIEKEGDARYKNLKLQVSNNQRNRLKKILEYDTNQLLAKSNKLSTNAFMNLFIATHQKEIDDYTFDYLVENRQYTVPSRGFKNKQEWRNFVDEERKIRTKMILELNKTKNFMEPLNEVCFYVNNNYHDNDYDKKTYDLFSNTNINNKKIILGWALRTQNISFGEREDRHIRLLLGDGSEQIHYYQIEISNGKRTKLIPIYEYLDHRDYGFKNNKSNVLVKAWIKRDKKLQGKKAKENIALSLEEKASIESSINSIRKEIKNLIDKGKYKDALVEVVKVRKVYPNDYNLLIEEGNLYFKMGDNIRFLDVLKKAVAIKPTEPQLFYNIGVMVMEIKDYKSAIENFEKAIALSPEYIDAYFNIGVSFVELGNELGEKMNKVVSDDKYDELSLKRKETFKKAIYYYEQVTKLASNDNIRKKQAEEMLNLLR